MNQAKTAEVPRSSPAPSDERGRSSNSGRLKARLPFFSRPWVVLIGSILLGVICFYGLRYVANAMATESTDDAFVEADYVTLAPRISGRVSRVPVKDNEFVRAGDTLVEIDPRDYQALVNERAAALEAAKAGVFAAETAREQYHSREVSAQADLAQREAEVQSVEATVARNTEDLKRNKMLLANHTISPQEFDNVQAAAREAAAELEATRKKVASSQALVGAARSQVTNSTASIESAKAQEQQAEASLETAQLNLSYTTITSPRDGYVTRKAVVEGDYVQPGQNLMAIVPTNVYVVANFKETQLKQMHPGQPVEIEISAFSGETHPGHVDSIMAGSGAAFSLLPPENAVGNFVKVVQRVPVKIVFNQPFESSHHLGPGMSVVPTVTVNDFHIATWILVVVGAVVGLLAAVLGLRHSATVARRREEAPPSPSDA